jgi:ubiquitin-protein ligase
MSTVRLRRLTADHERIQDYVRRHPRVKLVQADGSPPERYQLQYVIRSLKQSNGEVVLADSHMVEIVLPRNYPRTPPQCRMLSPVFHPNIAPHAICVGDHWGAGETLDSIVIRIGEMLAYQSYNVKSPLNGEAARWVEDNLQQVPTDKVSLLPEGEAAPTNSAASSPGAMPTIPVAMAVAPPPIAARPAPPPSVPTQSSSTAPPPQPGSRAAAATSDRIRVVCPNCEKAYSLPSEFRGRSAKCTKCQTSFKI